jgi:WD40 repeat protein
VAGGTGDPIINIGGVRIWDLPSGRERLHPAAEAARARREAAVRATEAEQAKARAARDKSEWATERARRAEYALAIAQAERNVEKWEFSQARALLDETPADLRGLEWHLLDARMPRERKLGEIGTAAISPKGDRACVGDADGIRVLDTATGKALFSAKGFRHTPGTAVFSADGGRLAVADYSPNADGSDVKVYDVTKGKELRSLSGHRDGVEDLAFSPDGRLLASCGRGNRVIVWDTKSWKAKHDWDDFEWIVSKVAFSPDGKRLAIGTVFKRFRIRDLATGKDVFEPAETHHNVGTRALLFLPGGKQVLADSPKGIAVIDAESGKVVRRLEAPRRSGGLLALAPGDRQLLLGWSLLDLASGKELARFEQGRRESVYPRRESDLLTAAVAPNGEVRLALSEDGEARLVTFPLGQPRRALRIKAEHLSSVTFSFDGERLVASTDGRTGKARFIWELFGADDRFVERWDAKGAAIKGDAPAADRLAAGCSFTPAGEKKARDVLAVSPDGRLVGLATPEEYLAVHDARTGKQVSLLKGKFTWQRLCRFTADGRGVTSWEEGDVVLWDAASGRERKRWPVQGA